MADNILEQIMDNGKKILDIDDVNGYSNNYGSISFEDENTNENDELIAKSIDLLAGVGYKTSNITTGEIFNSYPNNDNLSSTDSDYSDNDNDINKALQNYSHARNLATVANDHLAESTLGLYNISDNYGSWTQTTSLSDWGPTTTTLSDTFYGTATTTNALLIIGDGIGTSNRHNLLTLRSDCTGNNKAGSLSFSGNVDVDGHLAVTDYTYSPVTYTDTLCYTNGDQYELTGGTETFRLFDDDSEELTLENAKAKALEWVESSDNNKAFYRDPDSEEVYQIPQNELDINVPVATTETIDLNALNMSITNNLYLSSGGSTITTSDNVIYDYGDYSIAKAVLAPVLISGILSDDFMEKYTIDYDTALKLACVFDANLEVTATSYYTTSETSDTLKLLTIMINDDSKITNSITVSQQLSSFMYDAINDLDNDNLENYLFIFSLRHNSISSYDQCVLIPVNKETKKLSFSRAWILTMYRSPGTHSTNYFCPDVGDSSYIGDSDILRTQLIGSWWDMGSLTTHNTIKEVFPEYIMYLYSGSTVPTKDIANNDKWNSWYKNISISECFDEDTLEILTEKCGIDENLSLYDFIHMAAIQYLETGDIISSSTKKESWDLEAIVSANDVENWLSGVDNYISYDSDQKRYTVSNTSGLVTFIYGESPIIVASSGLKETRIILKNSFVKSCGFSFSYDCSSISNLFKTYPATFSEVTYKISDSKSYYFNSILIGEFSSDTLTFTEVSDPISFIDTSASRYVSLVNTGLNKTMALSLSDETGSAALSILGSEGSIETDTITWENLIDALNQNKNINILGTNLINLKTALSNVTDGTYCITSINGQIGLDDFTDSGWQSAELSAGNSNTGFGDVSIYYRTIGNLLYIKGNFTLKNGYSEGDYDSLILSSLIGEDAIMLSGIGMNTQSSTSDNLYTPCAISAYNNGVTYLIFYFLNTVSSGTSISFLLSGTIN